MGPDLIITLDKKQRFAHLGNKASNLACLIRLGKLVPLTHVLTWDAYQRYLKNDLIVIDQISREIDKKLDPTKKYAIRSSANLEDHFEYSFAGQFKTVLNVQGRDEILQAIWSIWATTVSPEVQRYLKKMQIGEDNLCMAVVLQEMVEPVCSGVAFSRNPTTGLPETVVEAVRGLGTALVQEGTTPDRWVSLGDRFIHSPAVSEIPFSIIQSVVEGTRKISRQLRRDIDLEWVYDGQDLYWVQMRDITTVQNIPLYSNRMAREMLPGMLKPLIWSVNIPLMVGDKIRLITELVGPNNLEPYKLVRQFYYRAYFNMSLLSEVLENIGFRAESIEMMWGIQSEVDGSGSTSARHKGAFRPNLSILRLLPRLLRFVWEKWRISPVLECRLSEMESALEILDLQKIESLLPGEIVQGIDRLYALNQEIAYDNVVIQLLAYVYNTILHSQLKKFGVDSTCLDMQLEGPDFNRFDPNYHLDLLHHRFFNLDPALQEKLKQSTIDDLINNPNFDGFREGTLAFLRTFGHLSDNGNDFSTRPWREDGNRVLQLVVNYAPHSKEQPIKGESNLYFDSLSIPWYHRLFIEPFYRRARQFRQFREHVSFIYTLGNSLFRVYFLALARQFIQQGLLEQPEDIFYLEFAEIRRLAAGGGDAAAILEKIAVHKREMEQLRNVVLPTLVYGDQPPMVETKIGQKLSGTPTSGGYCKARVKKVNGLGDFSKIEDGDILVIPYSDVGWTPLFARAGGIIAESGGILSHSSIVAREYGIPAIVSVGGATQLADGTLVSMDGFTGEVWIHSELPVTL